MRPVLPLALGLLLLPAAPRAAGAPACVARSAPLRTHLIELYTSEGCSACPPADAWLRGIQADASVVPLELHVDYWDALGWPDPYADARFSHRQRAMARRAGRALVYTPEVALDGREWRDWAKAALPASHALAAVTLTLQVAGRQPLQVRLATVARGGTQISGYSAWFALTEDGRVSHVEAGENGGRVLRHAHTVRAFAGPFALTDAVARLPVPERLQRSRSAVVAFLQDRDSGEIVQAVRLPLASCARSR